MLKIFIVSSLIISGCAGKRDYAMLTEQVAEYGVQRFEDDKNNVTCYIYRDKDSNSMTCLELQQSKRAKQQKAN